MFNLISIQDQGYKKRIYPTSPQIFITRDFSITFLFCEKIWRAHIDEKEIDIIISLILLIFTL